MHRRTTSSTEKWKIWLEAIESVCQPAPKRQERPKRGHPEFGRTVDYGR